MCDAYVYFCMCSYASVITQVPPQQHGGLENTVLMMLAIALAAAAVGLLGSVMLFAAHRVGAPHIGLVC